MECLPRPGGNIKMLISTQRETAEEKPLLPANDVFRLVSGFPRNQRWWWFPFPTSDSQLPTRPEIDDNDYVQSFVGCCLFSFFLCRKIKNIPANLLRLLLLQSPPCGTTEQIYLSQYDGATTMKTALTEGSTLLLTAPASQFPAPCSCFQLLLHLQPGIWLRRFPFPNCRHKVFPFFCIIVVLYLIWFFGHTPRPAFNNTPFSVVLEELRALRHGQVVGDAWKNLLKLQRKKLRGKAELEWGCCLYYNIYNFKIFKLLIKNLHLFLNLQQIISQQSSFISFLM